MEAASRKLHDARMTQVFNLIAARSEERAALVESGAMSHPYDLAAYDHTTFDERHNVEHNFYLGA